MFIAFSFVAMMCGYAYFSQRKYKLAGGISAAFAAIYATIILLVYFAQLTVLPMLGAFKAGSPKWIGVAVLTFWCFYFCPISILSFLHFSNCEERCGYE